MKKDFFIKIVVLLYMLSFPGYSGMKQPCGDTLPIFYSRKYNMSVLGIENFHPFDTKKFKKVYKHLRKNLNLCPEQFVSPYRITDEELLTVHSREYLSSLRRSKNIAKIVEIYALRFVPTVFLRNGLLEPMRLGSGGTVRGAKLALEKGWAINLSGGYHHAKAENGEGFCFFADIPIAIMSIWKDKPDVKVLIIDLDAHQGNGCSSILGNDKRVAILDMYNSQVYPNDTEAEAHVTYDVPILAGTNNSTYLGLLQEWLPVAINGHKPGLVIYNAGTDIYELDPLGALSITEDGIIKRDEIVFRAAIDNDIPILMVLSGGYHKKSGEIIAKSIENLLNTVLKNRR